MELNDTTILFYNKMLEAERAGVQVLTDVMRETGGSGLKPLLQKFLDDEGMNCRILTILIKQLNGDPSRMTGDFVGKVRALDSFREKLELLVRGQEWVAKQIRQNRALLHPGSSYLFMESIKVQHEENVDAVRQYLRELPAD